MELGVYGFFCFCSLVYWLLALVIFAERSTVAGSLVL
jgi:hypothetical protein